MLRIIRTLAGSLAVFLVAGVMVPAAANAYSWGKKTKTDAIATQSQGALISVQVYNRGQTPQGIKMAGQLYTVQPHQTITLKAAPGTDVYADTAGNGYQEGELLFRLQSAMNGATVKFN
jgi:hypothetical protein